MPFATAVTRGERRGWIRRRTARSIPLVEPRLTATAVPLATAAAVTPMPTRAESMLKKKSKRRTSGAAGARPWIPRLDKNQGWCEYIRIVREYSHLY